MWLKSVVGVGKLINSVDLYILLDLVGVGDWKVPAVLPKDATVWISHEPFEIRVMSRGNAG